MSGSSTTSVVARPEAPLVPVEAEGHYRFDLSRRSLYGLGAASLFAGFLLFLSGLALGLGLRLEAESGMGEAQVTRMRLSEEGGAELARAGRGSELQGSSSESAAAASPAVRHQAGPVESEATGPVEAVAAAADGVPGRGGAEVRTPVVPTPAGANEVAHPSAVRRAGGAAAGADAAAGRIGPLFVLQVGVFRLPENAQALRSRLQAAGYPVETRTLQNRSGEQLHRLLVGEFRDRAEADSAAARFRMDTGQEVYVMAEGELES